MNITECINRVDNQKPNQYSFEDKVEWLSYLDARVRKDIIDTHELKDADGKDIELPPFEPYSAEFPDEELIAPFPYDEMYVGYLKAKIDEMNEETTRYNNSATLFNTMYEEFSKAYNNEHLPKEHTFGWISKRRG